MLCYLPSIDDQGQRPKLNCPAAWETKPLPIKKHARMNYTPRVGHQSNPWGVFYDHEKAAKINSNDCA